MRNKLLILLLAISLAGNNSQTFATVVDCTPITTFISDNALTLAVTAAFSSFFAFACYQTFVRNHTNKYDNLTDEQFLKVCPRIISSLSNRAQPFKELLKKFDLYVQNNDEALILATLEEINQKIYRNPNNHK